MKNDRQSSVVNPTPSCTKEGLFDDASPMKINVPPLTHFLTKQHKRVGSTGTTADEFTTDDEDDDNIDEPDITIKDHVSRKLFNDENNSYSLGTTTSAMHRNSSDSSVYSELGLVTSSLEDESGDSNEDKTNYNRLQIELKKANQELKIRDEELNRLNRIRKDVEAELEDLTASLFQEAHNMVREANEKQVAAERSLKESLMKVDVLTAEVVALKTLVLTSTPSHPNPHLHPQIDVRLSNSSDGTIKKHRRSPSHFNLKYGRENSPPGSPIKTTSLHTNNTHVEIDAKDGLEVDPILHKEFLAWHHKPTFDKTNDAFLKRIYNEDISLCLSFTNGELSNKVVEAVANDTILIEAVGDKARTVFPKKCALLEVPRLCFYRMNLGETDVWYSISQICRNRIIAVCDFLNYLKYIDRGLVKSSVHDIYWETIRLRKNMVLARLGLYLPS